MSRAELVASLLGDLAAESEDLDARVADLPAVEWRRPTPAEGWDIRDTVTHLNSSDLAALRAATDPDGFEQFVAQMRSPEGQAVGGFVEGSVTEGRSVDPLQLLTNWRTDRLRLAAALREVPDGARIPWFGPPMSVPSFITARLMETWAHGQDVVDALGQTRQATPRLRHIAEIGVRATPFAYAINGVEMPTSPLRVELEAPDGQLWTWGPPDAEDRVSGPALDFCLLVTQRRHRDDLALTIHGSGARQWATIAQAYAGTPGRGREPHHGPGVR
jgi:uncharacterized protein (TIGR03084 family)